MPDTDLPQPDDPDLRLVRRGGRVELVQPDPVRPLCVDFLAGATAGRGAGIRRRTHPLARAVGRHLPLPAIVDGTAGLGRDAFVFARLGYRVLAIERDPVLHALLADGLTRLRADPRGSDLVADRLRLLLGDAAEVIAEPPAPPVVYLDPMFPARRKSAQVKKEMQLFQRLLGTGDSGAELLATARRFATDRVVVKRPTWAEPLAAGVNFAVTTPRMRWDVYLAAGAPANANAT